MNEISAMLGKVVSLEAIDGIKRGFANRRRWGEVASAVQCSVSYPAVINALRSGARWFNDGLQRASFRRIPRDRANIVQFSIALPIGQD